MARRRDRRMRRVPPQRGRLMNGHRTVVPDFMEAREDPLEIYPSRLVYFQEVQIHGTPTPGVQGDVALFSKALVLKVDIENPRRQAPDHGRTVILTADLEIGRLVDQPEVGPRDGS